jgi:hypothetical protein
VRLSIMFRAFAWLIADRLRRSRTWTKFEAKARLIDAAPELLEALKALSDGTTGNWTNKLAAARLAIAKAEGAANPVPRETDQAS